MNLIDVYVITECSPLIEILQIDPMRGERCTRHLSAHVK